MDADWLLLTALLVAALRFVRPTCDERADVGGPVRSGSARPEHEASSRRTSPTSRKRASPSHRADGERRAHRGFAGVPGARDDERRWRRAARASACAPRLHRGRKDRRPRSTTTAARTASGSAPRGAVRPLLRAGQAPFDLRSPGRRRHTLKKGVEGHAPQPRRGRDDDAALRLKNRSERDFDLDVDPHRVGPLSRRTMTSASARRSDPTSRAVAFETRNRLTNTATTPGPRTRAPRRSGSSACSPPARTRTSSSRSQKDATGGVKDDYFGKASADRLEAGRRRTSFFTPTAAAGRSGRAARRARNRSPGATARPSTCRRLYSSILGSTPPRNT